MDKLEGGIRTFTGKIISPLKPNLEDIDIRDIARGLLYMTRFGGQTLFFYPVLQHCYVGTKYLLKKGEKEAARWFLIHEGAEGLGMMDLPRPIKYLPEMEFYKTIEHTFQNLIYFRFGLYGKPPRIVKEIDIKMLHAEQKVLFSPAPEEALEIDTKGIVIKEIKRLKALEKNYLSLFSELFPDYKLDF